MSRTGFCVDVVGMKAGQDTAEFMSLAERFGSHGCADLLPKESCRGYVLIKKRGRRASVSRCRRNEVQLWSCK
jgi:hypothetical protein